MRAKEFITESVQEVTLNDLYHDNYPDQDELLWNFVGKNDFDISFTVRKINPLDLEEIIIDNYGVDELKDLFKKMQPEQKRLISGYKNDSSLSNQVIVMSGRRILDGHHRALASVLAKKPIKFIDVGEEQPKEGVAEGGAETSWSDGDEKITLQDVLELTKHIKQINLPINDNLKSKLIHWDGNPEEIERINQVTVSNQFPILVMLDGQGQIDWILDGNHRLHKAIRSQAKTIPAKLIKPSDLSDKAKRVFHIKDQGVTEAPLPPDWDPKKLNLRQTYKDRLQYALDRAKRLGGGSSRVAMTIDYQGRPTVLKVAKNAKGLAQNEAEIEILLDGYSGNLPIVIPLIDYDKANKRPVWLQTELARKVRSDTLAKLLHTLHLWDLIDCAEIILGNTKKYRKVNTIQEMKTLYFNENWPKNNPPTEKGWEIFLGYAHELADLASSTTIEIWDLNNASNWGIYNNRPVVLDLGFTEDTAELYGFTKK